MNLPYLVKKKITHITSLISALLISWIGILSISSCRPSSTLSMKSEMQETDPIDNHSDLELLVGDIVSVIESKKSKNSVYVEKTQIYLIHVISLKIKE